MFYFETLVSPGPLGYDLVQMTGFRWVTFSLILHGILYGFLYLWTDYLEDSPNRRKLIQFEPIKSEVEFISLDTEPNDLNSKQKAKFSALHKVRVKEQTKARFLGQTTNRRFPNLENTRKNKPSTLSTEDQRGSLSVRGSESKRQQMPLGISTVQSQLSNEIKYGDFTSLNTDQNLFFSFYTRAEARLRFHWEAGVERTIESLTFRNLAFREDKIFTTEVEVLLDSQGNYLKTQIYRSSGVPALDTAVVSSFEKSAPFVNPPQEMVRDDGLIHLNYAFRVYFSPQFYARP